MRLLAVAAALAAGVSVRTAAHDHQATSVLSLWPAQLNATLSVEDAQDIRHLVIKATAGSILAIETTTLTAVEFPDVNASSIGSIQLTWVAPHGSSSTWRRVAGTASIPALPVVFSAGVHVHVVAPHSQHGSLEVEDAVRGLLAGLSFEGITKLRSGFLVQSLCASMMFTGPHTRVNESCFSASFPFDAVPIKAPSTWTPSTQKLDVRVHSVVLSKAAHGFDVDTLSVSETQDRTLALPRDLVSTAAHETVALVTKLDDSTGAVSIRPLASTGLHTPAETATLPAPVKATVTVDIVGQGFHRHVRVRLSSDSSMCPHKVPLSSRLRVVVPLATSVYADLDELRRMERFGELVLHAPAKHIEIERPMAVSSQHVLALDFAMDQTESLQEFTFPIHLRYQSPANDSFYSRVAMISPEIFVSCGDCAESSTDPQPPVIGKPWDTLFARWLGTQETSHWQRIAPSAPLVVEAVLVPVGFTQHAGLVSVLTISVTSIGALLLSYVAITSSRVSSDSPPSVWRPKSA